MGVDSLQGPGQRDGAYTAAAVVSPHDTNDLAFWSRALYIGGAGNVRVLTMSDQDVLFSALPVGTVLRIRAKRVFATDTTATLIVALW